MSKPNCRRPTIAATPIASYRTPSFRHDVVCYHPPGDVYSAVVASEDKPSVLAESGCEEPAGDEDIASVGRICVSIYGTSGTISIAYLDGLGL